MSEETQTLRPPAIDQILTDLHGNGRPRVWSIIISAFGDLLPGRREDFPAAALQEIMDQLRVEPGAVRTALSRLAKEGWITRERTGRRSAYRLSEKAAPTFALASRTIYAPVRPEPDGPAQLLIWPEGGNPPAGDATVLQRNLSLVFGGGADDLPEEVIKTGPITTLPGWAMEVLAPVALRDALVRLVETFQPIEGTDLSPVEAAAMRVALIHAWRRVALRHPMVPDVLLPDDWPEPACRRFVRHLHQRLSQFAEPWLVSALAEDGKHVLQKS